MDQLHANTHLKSFSRVEELQENDAIFVRDIISLFSNYSETQIKNGTSKDFNSPKGIQEFLESLELKSNEILIDREGHICKLNLRSWFTELLPFWIKEIVDLKRSHGFSKNEIIDSINRFVSHNILTSSEIDPCGNLLVDLPAWYLSIIPETIGLLSKLEYLDLGDNHLIKLPESIKDLRALKELHLSFNMFNDLPDWMVELPKLECLDASCNPLQGVPHCVIKIAEKRYAHFHKEVPHAEAIILGVLDILSGGVLSKLEDNQFQYACNYRVNEDGHVSHIYIDGEGVLVEFFPKILCELAHLEELYILPNAITSLPESLSNLAKLRVLNLWSYRNAVEDWRGDDFKIPESIFPFLKKLDEFIYDHKVLKKFGLDRRE